MFFPVDVSMDSTTNIFTYYKIINLKIFDRALFELWLHWWILQRENLHLNLLQSLTRQKVYRFGLRDKQRDKDKKKKETKEKVKRKKKEKVKRKKKEKVKRKKKSKERKKKKEEKRKKKKEKRKRKRKKKKEKKT